MWKTRTTPWHPHCNDQVEQFNRTLVGVIKSYLKGQKHNWDQHLGCLAATYLATPHEITGMRPNLLMFGREVRMPIEVIFGVSKNQNQEGVTSCGDNVDTLREQMHQAHDIAQKYLGKNAIWLKEHYDAKCTVTECKHGELVWHATYIKQLHLAPKLWVPFEGLYLILDKIRYLDYYIQLDAKGKQKVVHHDKFKPYAGTKGLVLILGCPQSKEQVGNQLYVKHICMWCELCSNTLGFVWFVCGGWAGVNLQCHPRPAWYTQGGVAPAIQGGRMQDSGNVGS